jgi:hypothetical protein
VTTAASGDKGGYEPPRVEDLGRLEVLTRNKSNSGNLDGGSGNTKRS